MTKEDVLSVALTKALREILSIVGGVTIEKTEVVSGPDGVRIDFSTSTFTSRTDRMRFSARYEETGISLTMAQGVILVKSPRGAGIRDAFGRLSEKLAGYSRIMQTLTAVKTGGGACTCPGPAGSEHRSDCPSLEVPTHVPVAD